MKYLKDTLLTLGVLTGGVVAVMGYHWSEVAETPFWWNAWMVLGIACTIAWFGGWLYLWNKDRKNAKRGR